MGKQRVARDGPRAGTMNGDIWRALDNVPRTVEEIAARSGVDDGTTHQRAKHPRRGRVLKKLKYLEEDGFAREVEGGKWVKGYGS
jgi:hypothetical protein